MLRGVMFLIFWLVGEMRSSTEIAEEILRRIQLGRYRPGDPLSQYELAGEFNTSRTPVREALRFLEAKRAITLTASGRAVVAIPSVKAVREAFEIRAELEGLAARLAVDWISDQELERLRGFQDDYALTLRSRVLGNSGSEWLKHNHDFHELITLAGHNERLHQMITELQGGSVANALSFASKMPPRLMEENIQQHENIIKALARRDAAESRIAMIEHIQRTMHLVLDWMSTR
ncbi:GntR family transcriptional regulator [Cupriavidus pauculus]|uniref:GntR family transcriptional regulator n=1 Tax=Cupriavidus pauculus TaxID=82633 RepID=UPI0034E5357C